MMDAYEKNDAVNHPAHYTNGKVECIDAIESMLALEDDGLTGFLKGQVVKYVWRAGFKGARLQDLKKAQWYLERLIKTIEGWERVSAGSQAAKPSALEDEDDS